MPAEAAVTLSDVLSRAHAHNDYEHDRPLRDALELGFTSVEADVWLEGGELLVAHTWFGLDEARTLESLYLEPLLERTTAHAGRVYADWPHSVQLLIDLKSEGEATYMALHDLLARYRAMLTTFVDGEAHEAAVTVVVTGNRPRALMQEQYVRYAAYDGRGDELDGAGPATFMPLVSDRWGALFDWNGDGDMPPDERQRLHDYVRAAHDSGRRVRFWSTPDDFPHCLAVWRELLAAGVDYVNSDQLPALSRWLTSADPRPSTPSVDWFKPSELQGPDYRRASPSLPN